MTDKESNWAWDLEVVVSPCDDVEPIPPDFVFTLDIRRISNKEVLITQVSPGDIFDVLIEHNWTAYIRSDAAKFVPMPTWAKLMME
tara:strand:- start:6133 stop:6390 length:258 start_codon:yes stop_codon:yes gene_type:complete